MSRLKSNQVRYTFAKTKVKDAFWHANGDGVKVAMWLTDRFAKLHFYTEGEDGRHVDVGPVIVSTAPRVHSKVSKEMIGSAGLWSNGWPLPIEVLEKAYRNDSKLAVTVDIERSKGGKCWNFVEATFTTWRNEEVSI